MGLEDILSRVELFQGLESDELRLIGTLFHEMAYQRGEMITTQGSAGDSFSIISDGFVEVSITGRAEGSAGDSQVLINLGRGQIFGEMSLVDQGLRSASVSAISDRTVVYTADRTGFLALCEDHPHIGFVVMRNIAADLSFKLRKQNLYRG